MKKTLQTRPNLKHHITKYKDRNHYNVCLYVVVTVYVYKFICYTDESRYVKLGLLEISVKSKFFWSPVLN
jgi:hypothetical protein